MVILCVSQLAKIAQFAILLFDFHIKFLTAYAIKLNWRFSFSQNFEIFFQCDSLGFPDSAKTAEGSVFLDFSFACPPNQRFG